MKTIIKKMMILVLITLSTNALAGQYFGPWKHHYAEREGITFRVSFQESHVAPTYGLHHGGRTAHYVHIDAYGNTGWKSIDYRLINKVKDEVKREFTGTLIKNSNNHQYASVLEGERLNYIWIQGNDRHNQTLEVRIDGRTYRINFSF